MGRVKTFTNGGSLLPGDLNSIEDDYEFAASTYKPAGIDGSGVVGASQPAATLLLAPGNNNALGNTNDFALFYMDPADVTFNTRTTKIRLRAICVTGGTGPAVTLTVGLYPVSAVAGGALTLGAVVAGSTVAFASPAGNGLSQANSGDFTAPAAGFYALGLVVSATTAASSVTTVRAVLQVRQV